MEVSDRWWAPTRPTVTPDAVVLALMQNDGDPAGDLGASLLGLHRAGAAACDLVSKQAVPSEAALTNALVTFQSDLRTKLVESVSKSLEPSYAGLLVRDVCDDADSAAVDLYRACVAKGVSPPMAVSRVGAVYGVPAHDLGKYRSLALDRKSNQVELTDAADRCLLTYVSKLVRSETGESKQEITKATVTAAPEEAPRPWDPDLHDRGTGGRFATMTATTRTLSPTEKLRQRLGLLVAAPDVVADIVEKPQVKQKTGSLRRQTRKTRKTRVHAKPLQAPLESTKLKAKGLASAKLRGQSVLKLRKLLGIPQEPARPPRTVGHPGGRTQVAPAMEKFPAPVELPYMNTIHDKIAFYLGKQETEDFIANMATNKRGQPIFRMGHLNGQIADPASWEDATQRDMTEGGGLAEAPSDARLGEVADFEISTTTHPSYRPPSVKQLDYGEDDEQAYQDQIMHMTERYASDPIRRAREQANMEPFADYWGGPSVILHSRSPKGANWDSARPIPEINELVVDAPSGYLGYEEKTHTDNSKQDSWELDPNQIWVMRSISEPMWDDDHQIVVNRWYISPEDDDNDDRGDLGEFTETQKADTSTLERPVEQADFNQLHPHGAGGRFVATGARAKVKSPTERLREVLTAEAAQKEQPVEQVAVAPRVQLRRKTRKTRHRRTSAQTPVDTQQLTAQSLRSASLVGAPVGSTTRLAAKVLQAVKESRKRPDPGFNPAGMVVLHDRDTYKVLDKGGWSSLKEVIPDSDLRTLKNPGDAVTLGGLARSRIFGEGGALRHISTSQDQLVFNTVNALAPSVYESNEAIRHFYETSSVGPSFDLPYGYTISGNEQRNRAVADQIAQTFRDHPEADSLELAPYRGGEKGSGEWELRRNQRRVATQRIVQVDENADQDDPSLQIIYAGKFRASEVSVDQRGVAIPLISPSVDDSFAGALNPWVAVYRVASPKVDG